MNCSHFMNVPTLRFSTMINILIFHNIYTHNKLMNINALSPYIAFDISIFFKYVAQTNILPFPCWAGGWWPHTHTHTFYDHTRHLHSHFVTKRKYRTFIYLIGLIELFSKFFFTLFPPNSKNIFIRQRK